MRTTPSNIRNMEHPPPPHTPPPLPTTSRPPPPPPANLSGHSRCRCTCSDESDPNTKPVQNGSIIPDTPSPLLLDLSTTADIEPPPLGLMSSTHPVPTN